MNQHIASRLNGIHRVLWSAFEAGDPLSATSKGFERETFISLFLSEVFPPIYRFGRGDITDSLNQTSGQIDIVIEMPWAPSFPTPIGSGVRLYPAEAVGTAIEVKSNLEAQWGQVVDKAIALEPLRQKLGGITVKDDNLAIEKITKEPVPFYAVGYKGWSTLATVKERARNAPVDGILVLEYKIFAWSDRRPYLRRLAQCQDELDKEQRGEPFDKTLAACARIAELRKTEESPGNIVRALNDERWSVRPVRLEDDQPFLPSVDAGNWTKEALQKVTAVLQQKTNVLTDNKVLLQFVNVVHREVAKRAAMSVDLMDYAS